MRQHTHEIDGKLHEGCHMCDHIKQLMPRVAKERRERVAREQAGPVLTEPE